MIKKELVFQYIANTDAACLLPQRAISAVKIIFVVTKSRVHRGIYCIYIYIKRKSRQFAVSELKSRSP